MNAAAPTAPAASPAQIRARAARIVAQVAQGKSLDSLLAATGADSAQTRGLLRTLVYGTIRWQIRLQALLKAMLARPDASLDDDVHALLLVGLFQLAHTDIAAHAAVAETVQAARVMKQPKAAGLINAVLRRFQREASVLSARVDSQLATRTAHPDWLVQSLKHDWPNQYQAILDANNAHPPMWLRVNARRISVSEYLLRLQSAGWSAQASDVAPHAVLLATPVDVRALPGFEQGDVSVQDAAAQWAAPLLAPQAGERVLDACVAPGGKACHVLELQPNVGELVGVDESKPRLRRVEENLRRLDLQATLLAGDAASPKDWWDGHAFERILLDAPCSATGVIRRHPDIKLLRRATDIGPLAARQSAMLRALWPLLAPGGRLLYCTCSVLHAENAAVIDDFLREHPDARDVTRERLAELAGAAVPLQEGPGHAIAAGWAQMDGFYYACLDKMR